MKKFKMIAASVVVLAIVGSAFAFKAKKEGTFCTSPTTTNACNVVKDNVKRVTSGGTAYLYYAAWDGDPATCVGTNNCTTSVNLAGN